MAKKDGGNIIIIKRVKKGGHGHHGGGWKVAFADFMTAMMAFFLVMWIVGMDESTKAAVEGYFSNPVGFKKGYSMGSSPLSSGASPATISTNSIKLVSRAQQESLFVKSEAVIQKRLEEAGIDGIKASVTVTVTKEGLRIELAEGDSGNVFFPAGSSDMQPVMRDALGIIAHELRRFGNPVVVEGHTDARPYPPGGYSNWELSADRANAARRVLERSGLNAMRIAEVRGMGDRQLKYPKDPRDPCNRRITIVVPFKDDVIAPAAPVTEAVKRLNG